jgi:photosystem II stability/assembly factor-like uncharacterized protein
MRVYRTRNGGKSWEALTNGLPQKNAHETVLRDGLTVDALNPAGVYFGTRSGKLYASADGGSSWKLVSDGLPQVLCVRVAVIGDAAKLRVPAAGKAAKSAAPSKRTLRTVAKVAAKKTPPKPATKRTPAGKVAKPAAKKKPGGARPKRAR